MKIIYMSIYITESFCCILGFPGGASGKEPTCHCSRHKRCRFDPWVRKTPWKRAWQPIPLFLPEKSHGQRGLVGYSPQNHESQTRLKQFYKHAETNATL